MKSIIQLIKRLREEYILLTAFGPIQRKWLRFLKNNPDKQERGVLGNKYPNGSYRVCCLGQFGLMTGICEWSDTVLISSIDDNEKRASYELPELNNMLNYGFRERNAPHKDSEKHSLVYYNDNGTWLDVYNACINDPKGYFTKKV